LGVKLVQAIIFDFWGTLVENGVWSPIKQVRNILGIRMNFSEYVVRMEKAMMTKDFPTLKDAFQSVCEEFNINCHDYKLDKLVGMWNKSWMLAKPYDEVEEMLKKLKKKYKIILMSNTDCFSIKNVLEKYKLGQYFDEVFLSCDLGTIKTDETFLKMILDEVGLSAEECLVVGDSMLSDISAAEKSGVPAILVDRKNRREHEPKVKDLYGLEEFLENNT